MKAEIILENIGQYRGIKRYEINSGLITQFNGKNSLGKTTIIKTIATALSYPTKSKNLIEESYKFGILPREGQAAPLVNYDEDYAKITLKFGEKSVETTIYKDGRIESKSNFKTNEIFLYACMLVKNSKIQEYLASGNHDFGWIVEEMSSAGKYQELKENIDSYIRLNDASLDNLEDLNKKIGVYLEKIREQSEKLPQLEEELENILKEKKNIDMSKVPKYNELETEKKAKLDDIEIAKEKSNITETTINNVKEETEESKSKLKSLESEIERREQQIKQIDESIEKLKKNNTKKLQEEIIKNQEEIPPLSEQLGHFKVYKELNNTLYQSRLESVDCPLCNTKVKISQETAKKRVKEYQVKIDEVLTNKSIFEAEIDRLKNLLEETKKVPQLKKKRDQIQSTIQTKQNQIGTLKKNIPGKKTQLNHAQIAYIELRNNIKLLITEVHNIQIKIDKIVEEFEDLKRLNEEEKKITDRLNNIKASIQTNRNHIKESSEINVSGIKVPTEKAKVIMTKLTEELKTTNRYLMKKINEQKLGAAKKFNNSIKTVIEELNLKNFEKIQINNNTYRLELLKTGGKPQAPGSLGGAERGIIGGILQISCKQTYLKEIPFFVGDDIILEFDPENAMNFMNYLKKIAKEEDIFIVMTKPTNDTKMIQLEI